MKGTLPSAMPRSARVRGPLEKPSPSRSCESQGFSRQTPVHERSNRALPSLTGPSFCTPATSDPLKRVRPSVPLYAPPSGPGLVGTRTL